MFERRSELRETNDSGLAMCDQPSVSTQCLNRSSYRVGHIISFNWFSKEEGHFAQKETLDMKDAYLKELDGSLRK